MSSRSLYDELLDAVAARCERLVHLNDFHRNKSRPDGLAVWCKPCVKAWLAAHREFRLVPVPAYSPNLNLIERLWKFLRKKALSRWHVTFEGMQAAVAEVLDRLGEYRDELSTLMTERFAIVEVEPAVV